MNQAVEFEEALSSGKFFPLKQVALEEFGGGRLVSSVLDERTWLFGTALHYCLPKECFPSFKAQLESAIFSGGKLVRRLVRVYCIAFPEDVAVLVGKLIELNRADVVVFFIRHSRSASVYEAVGFVNFCKSACSHSLFEAFAMNACESIPEFVWESPQFIAFVSRETIASNLRRDHMYYVVILLRLGGKVPRSVVPAEILDSLFSVALKIMESPSHPFMLAMRDIKQLFTQYNSSVFEQFSQRITEHSGN